MKNRFQNFPFKFNLAPLHQGVGRSPRRGLDRGGTAGGGAGGQEHGTVSRGGARQAGVTRTAGSRRRRECQRMLTAGAYHLLTIVHVFTPHLSCLV